MRFVFEAQFDLLLHYLVPPSLSHSKGGDLDAKILQWRDSGRVFDESLIVDWFIQLTTAVKYIHERRILHRDLKTRNIFLKNNLIKLGIQEYLSLSLSLPPSPSLSLPPSLSLSLSPLPPPISRVFLSHAR